MLWLAQYKKAFIDDLNSRINLEKSRNFKSIKLKKGNERLEKIAQKIKAHISQNLNKKCHQKNLCISIIGSNGKGSTAFLLAKFLSDTRVSLYTSPHLLDVLERIQIKKRLSKLKPLSYKKAYQGLSELKKILKKEYKELSYFEILTVLAYYLFLKAKCPIQIYEAGIGGRYDATKIAEAQVVILTSITWEHVDILGPTIRNIIEEKIGICHPQSTHFFCYEKQVIQEGISKEDIQEILKKQAPKAKIYFYKESSKSKNYIEANSNFAKFIIDSLGLKRKKHLKNLKVWGRLEKRKINIGSSSKYVYFDVAHNPQGIEKTLTELKQNLPSSKLEESTLICLAILKGRDNVLAWQSILRCGFSQNIFQLLGKDWAKLASPKVIPWEEKNILENIKKELKKEKINRLIFLGTHRSYPIFKALRKL